MKILLIVLWFTALHGYAQPFPHAGTHAHNDYVHEHPLFDALSNGFTSIEADVHLVSGQLMVSHDQPGKEAKTLDRLYLHPLDSIIKRNNGNVYPMYHHPVILMIDVKTAADETLTALLKVLLPYKQVLQRPDHPGAIQVIISGNRAGDLIQNDPDHLTSIDGRPGDIGKNYSNDLMPVISEAYVKVSGENSPTPSAKALQQIKDLAFRVHAEKKKLRLWAMPDNQNAWKLLTEAGVDMINTDKLQEVHQYLTATGK